jgi:hypothetical protein
MSTRTFSVTPKRAAYMLAGEPYGRNRKGLKRWLREQKGHCPRGGWHEYVESDLGDYCSKCGLFFPDGFESRDGAPLLTSR